MRGTVRDRRSARWQLLTAPAGAACLALVGCYAQTTTDVGPSPMDVPVLDAPRPDVPDTPVDVRPDVPEDAPPPVVQHWSRADPLAASLDWPPCPVPSSEPVLELSVLLNGCDELGNVLWSVEPGARVIRVEPVVWRPLLDRPCEQPPQELFETVHLAGAALESGSWTVLLAGKSSRLEISPESGDPCSSVCEVDGVCLGRPSASACNLACLAPCFPRGSMIEEPDCTARFGESAACIESSGAGVCVRIPVNCDACPAGMTCNRGRTRCVWNIPSDRVSEECSTEADCHPGLSCVDGAAGRTCELRCRNGHPCPFGTTCGHTEATCPRP